MTQTEYGVMVTSFITATLGEEFEFPESFEGDVAACFQNRLPAELAADKLANDYTTTDESLVCGKQVQYDNSGVGHNWRNKDADDLPADIRMEIEAEIINGGRETCGDYVGSNGLHYRW